MENERRKIIHVDMDQFFAAVEQRDNPDLRGKPVAVGYDGERGVVSTASYEARRFGVHSAQSVMVAKRLCPDLIIVPGHYNKYKEVSAQIHDIFHDYTDIIEPLSLDEAFLDVTSNKVDEELAVNIAVDIKRRILEEIQLTASAGVSYCKFLAKVASDYRKPDGLCVVHPDRALDFIAQLPIERFWLVGRKTAERMHRLGIHNGYQLRQFSLQYLTDKFGKAGQLFYDFARGIDDRPVVTDWVRKSVGCEHTFLKDISRRSEVTIELYHTVLELLERIQKTQFKGHTLTLKVKFHDFTQITRSLTVNDILMEKAQILPLAKQLMREVDYAQRPIRLLGLSVSHAEVEEEKPLHGQVEKWEEGYLPFEEMKVSPDLSKGGSARGDALASPIVLPFVRSTKKR
ncbi:MAG: DNA polymerase IV [Prevotella sp.]|nr:DNA polymerase IV [Prevotella sp.]